MSCLLSCLGSWYRKVVVQERALGERTAVEGELGLRQKTSSS